MSLIKIDVVREKTGCRPDCEVSISDDGKVQHNKTHWQLDVEKYMDPAYDGPGWLTVAMDKIAEQHA